MKLQSIVGTLVVLGLVASLHAEELEVYSDQFVLKPGQTLRIDVPVGQVRTVATDGDMASVEVVLDCERSERRCQRTVEKVEVELDTHDGKLSLEVEGYRPGRDMDLEIVASIPRANPLEIDLGIGSVTVEGMTADLHIDIGIGEATVSALERDVASVRLDSGIGEVNLELAEGTVHAERSFLGDEIRWRDGSGNADLTIDVGIGKVEVDLD